MKKYFIIFIAGICKLALANSQSFTLSIHKDISYSYINPYTSDQYKNVIIIKSKNSLKEDETIPYMYSNFTLWKEFTIDRQNTSIVTIAIQGKSSVRNICTIDPNKYYKSDEGYSLYLDRIDVYLKAENNPYSGKEAAGVYCEVYTLETGNKSWVYDKDFTDANYANPIFVWKYTDGQIDPNSF